MTKNSKKSSEEGRSGLERSPAKDKNKKADRIQKETDERVAGKGRFRGKKPKLRAGEGSDKTPGTAPATKMDWDDKGGGEPRQPLKASTVKKATKKPPVPARYPTATSA